MPIVKCPSRRNRAVAAHPAAASSAAADPVDARPDLTAPAATVAAPRPPVRAVGPDAGGGGPHVRNAGVSARDLDGLLALNPVEKGGVFVATLHR